MVVKKTVTYREITVAIGILVAMVIALTLWIKTPGEKITESGSMPLSRIGSIALPIQISEHLQELSFELLQNR